MNIILQRDEHILAQQVRQAADQLSTSAFMVGGFVRDKLLGRNTKDIDWVTEGDGIALAKHVALLLKPSPTVSIFKSYGTAHFKYQGIEVEFVGARKESYESHSHKPAVSPGTLQDDQNRRDFTINALAISCHDESLSVIDPFGGLEDLSNKIIRTPLDPNITFSDDPLRMMRAIRFATQLGFSIHPATYAALAQNKERLKIVAQERITDELNKIISTPKPSIGFDLLYKTGLLHQFFPQMVKLAGAQMIEGIGHKDNFYHTLQVLDQVALRSNSLWLRWAAILHDIGKPATKKFEPGIGWTFHGHDAVGERMTKKIFAQLKLPLTEPMKYVSKLVALHLRPISLSKNEITDSAIRRLLFDAGEHFDDLMILCESDITSKNKMKVKRYLDNFELVRERCAIVEEKDRIRNWQPPITGEEIMQRYNLSPSREVGILKTIVREAILDGIIANDKDAALQLMDTEAEKLGLTKV